MTLMTMDSISKIQCFGGAVQNGKSKILYINKYD
jgi:hypothetical protein